MFSTPRTATALAATTAVVTVALLLLHRRRRQQQQPSQHRHAPTTALPRTVVISLARRPAKRSAVLQRAAEAGLGGVAELFEAVDGRALTPESLAARGVALYRGWRLPDSTNRFFSRELKLGEVGCALSHHGAWQLTAAHGGPVLVLEDDVAFAPDFAALLLLALREVDALVAEGLAQPPDLLYVARRAMQPDRERLPRSDAGRDTGRPRPGLALPGFSYKTTGYVLWPSGAAKLLRSGYLQRLVPVDDLLPCLYTRHAVAGQERPDLDQLFADAPRLHALTVRPSLAWERPGVSDTENSKPVMDS